MSIQSPTGILDVTNATLRAGKLESTGDITCSSNLVVSGGFDLSAINSNADTVVDFTATRQLRKYPREILTSASQNGHVVSTPVANSTAWKAFNEIEYGNNDRWFSTCRGETDRYSLSTVILRRRRTITLSPVPVHAEWHCGRFVPSVCTNHSPSVRDRFQITDVFVIGEAPRDQARGPTTEPRGPKLRSRTHRPRWNGRHRYVSRERHGRGQ